MRPTFKIVTLGCKVNQYESAYLAESLSELGWRRLRPGQAADVCVVNTCIVTQKAAHQSRQAIRKAIRETPRGLVAAVGCYAQVYPEELRRIEGLRLIADNTAKGNLPSLLTDGVESRRKVEATADFPSAPAFEFLPVHQQPDRSRVYLKIQDGCRAFCSYCIVPYARGPYRSLDPNRVLSALHDFARAGCREVVLTGIHLGKYGVDLAGCKGLTELLRRIGDEALPLRIRLSSLHPNEIGSELIELMATEHWLCRHLHISLQSGDDRILKRMKRDYTARDFASLIKRAHEAAPLAAVGVDLMAGFPGEDTRAHQNTLSLIRELPVSYLHVFPYSERPGTEAASLEGRADPRRIRTRARALRDLGAEKRMAFYSRSLYQPFEVLVEGWHSRKDGLAEGTTDNYLPVVFESPSPQKGRVLEVFAHALTGDRVMGVPANPSLAG